MEQKFFFLLGADDPEMRAIKRLLDAQNRPYRHATVNGVGPVHPGNAYSASPIAENIIAAACGEENCEIVYVECMESVLPSRLPWRVIDHHKPGDPGYSMPPAQYWEASSLGQLHKLLGIEPAKEAQILAAMDHCFSAAVRGECPGVSPEEVIALEYREIAAGTKTNEAIVRGRVEFFKNELRISPDKTIGGQIIKDLRRHNLGEGYSLDLLAAQAAAAIEGYAVLLRHRDRDGQPEKWTLAGNAAPETVVAFKEIWGPAHGLVRVYGVPVRGYAGGYTV